MAKRNTDTPAQADAPVLTTRVFEMRDFDRLTAILSQARGIAGLISAFARGDEDEVADAAYAINETAWALKDMIEEAAAIVGDAQHGEAP